MTPTPKHPPVRDRAYLEYLKTQPCILTGFRATDSEAVDPAHIGQAGMGMKSGDDEALPIRHSLHARMHNTGEMEIISRNMPYWLLREAFRAYAREQYRKWKMEKA